MSDRELFIRKSGDDAVIIGPLPEARVKHFLLLGKFKPHDEYSCDKSEWKRLDKLKVDGGDDSEVLARSGLRRCERCGSVLLPNETACPDCPRLGRQRQTAKENAKLREAGKRARLEFERESSSGFNIARHDSVITRIVPSPDGRHVVSCSGSSDLFEEQESATLNISHAETGETIFEVHNRFTAVEAAAFAPNSRLVVWQLEEEKPIVVWDVDRQETSVEFEAGKRPLTFLAFSGQSDCLYIADDRGDFQVVAIDDGSVLQSGRLPGPTVASSDVGDQLIVGNDKGKLFLWDVVQSRVVAELQKTGRFRSRKGAHQTGINDVALCGSFPLGASCSGQLIETEKPTAAGLIGSILMGDLEGGLISSLQGRNATKWANQELRKTTQASVWNLKTGEELFHFGLEPGGHTQGVTRVAFHPQGRFLVTGCFDGFLRVWDLVSGRCTGNRNMQFGPITALAFLPDGTGVYYAALESGDVSKWSPKCLRE